MTSARGLVVVKEEIKADTRWTCQKSYEIEGTLVVSAGTLTIDPGVRVLGRERAALVVSKTARIEALGTAQQPIVFAPKERPAEPGRWRGIIMLGSAPTALSNDRPLGLPVGDVRGYFGGTNASHDCGTLRYVRLEFGGGSVNETDLPTGAALTLAGCGSDTEIDHVQVHAATDGIGLIGGRAPLKRVLVSAPGADGIEWAAGYQGLIQFAIVQGFYGAGAALKGSQREVDENAIPFSSPIIFNATLVGARSKGLPGGSSDPNGFETALQLQAGTRGIVRNSLVQGFAGAWVDVIGAAAGQRMKDGELVISNTIFGGLEPGDGDAGTEFGGDDGDGLMEADQIRLGPLKNRFPLTSFALRNPFAVPPARPDFSAEGFVDSPNSLSTEVPSEWQGVFEVAAYAGALPKIGKFVAERERDWTWSGQTEVNAWTAFPQE